MDDPPLLPSARPEARRRKAWRLLVLGLGGIALAHWGRARGIELIATWFYVLAWWSLIFALDGAIYLKRGRSLILSRPQTARRIALFSCAFWLVFELINLRLQNWYYVGLPTDFLSRGPGFFIAFATVLPAIFELADALEVLGLERLRLRPLRLEPETWARVRRVGVVFFVLPLLFPRFTYPLIWGAAILWLEPWLARNKKPGLWQDLERGEGARLVRLLLAGFICGGLWESWNHGSSAKWIYTVPFFEQLKLFEMPLLGFLGFPPFALECYSFGRYLVGRGWIEDWESEAVEPEPARSFDRVAFASLAFSVFAIAAVNLWTVRGTRPMVNEISGLPKGVEERLAARGIRHVEDFLAAFEGLRSDRELREYYRHELELWHDQAQLMTLRGMGSRGVHWLHAAQVQDLETLAAADWKQIVERLKPQTGPRPRPTSAEVRVWIRAARAQTSTTASGSRNTSRALTTFSNSPDMRDTTER